MKRVLAICLLIALVCPVAWGAAKSVITNFGGVSSASETDVPPGVAVDVVNFDFRSSIAYPGISLTLRDGYRRIGNVQAGLTSGPWVFSTPTIDRQLLAVFGRDLKMYDPGSDKWVGAGVYPLADTCMCSTDVKYVRSIRNKNWWPYSVEDYDTLSIAGFVYGIEKIMGDSLIVLDGDAPGIDSLPGWTSAAVPCTLKMSGSLGSSQLFTSAQDDKYAIMFEDTLHIITPDEKIKYGGASPTGVAAVLTFDSIGAWNDSNMTITLYGAEGDNGWTQIGPEMNYDLNIALYSVTHSGNSNTFRCDTAIAKWLTDNPDSSWLLKPIASPAWDTLFAATVSTVEVDSVFAYWEPYGQTTRIARAMVGPLFTSKTYLRQVATTYRPVYIYRWKVSATSVATDPASWPLDSLTYMTTYHDNGYAGTVKNGFYRKQIPVTMDTLTTGDTCIYLTTIGYPGISLTSFDSSAAWRLHPEASPGGDCDNGAATCSWPDYYSPVLTMDYETAPDLDTARWATAHTFCGSSDNKRFAVQCTTVYAPLTLTDGGNNASSCYDVGDSLVLTRMTRATRTPLGSGTVRDTVQVGVTKVPWSWGYCVEGMGRFFCIDQDTAKSTVYWTAQSNPDSFGVADFENAFPDDGRTLTTLGVEQNIVYAHAPTAIFTIPMATDDDGLSQEATGIFKTRAQYGALSPKGLVGTPYGWYFVGYPGVFEFDGYNATLMSSEVSWFWRDSLAAADVVNACIKYDTHRDILLISVARRGSIKNDVTLVYHFPTRQWSRYDFGADHFEQVSYPTNNPQLYWADANVMDGGVYRMDDTLTRDLGETINAYFRTGIEILGQTIGDRGQLTEWYLQGRWNSLANVSLSTFLNGSSTAHFVDTIPMGTGGWRPARMVFPLGVSGWYAQFLIQVQDADTCNLTGFRYDLVPEGTVDQK